MNLKFRVCGVKITASGDNRLMKLRQIDNRNLVVSFTHETIAFSLISLEVIDGTTQKVEEFLVSSSGTTGNLLAVFSRASG